jgi:hypothetical protein
MESEEQKEPPESEIPITSQTQRLANLTRFVPSQKDTKQKLAERQEATRSELARALIWILGGTLTASFVLMITLTVVSGFLIKSERVETFDKNSSTIKDLITFILTSQTGLIGTALGFYFGSRGNNAD